MMQVVKSVNGTILWANLHFLFWLSLMPLVTEWMGENKFSKWPIILYGTSLIMCAISYTILSFVLIKHEGKNSLLAVAVGSDRKGKISIIIYTIGIACAWINPYISFGLYCMVACIWFIPDRRIEKKIVNE
jgi:uncharacterized membrane protein